jgi:hypothetical protein
MKDKHRPPKHWPRYFGYDPIRGEHGTTMLITYNPKRTEETIVLEQWDGWAWDENGDLKKPNEEVENT